MFDSKAWLEETLQSGIVRHERLCFLVTANGGFDVHGWGFIGFGGVHQQGLEQNEALELMCVTAFMNGLEAAGVKVFDTFKPYFDAYQAKLVATIKGEKP